MAQLADRLAVQSYCYRGFSDNAKVAQMLKQSGLAAIEICAAHIDFDDVACFEQVIDTYRQAGIKIIGAGVEGIRLDEQAMRKRFEFVRQSGAQVINIAFPADATEANYRLAEKLCEEYNVHGSLHNHGSRHWQGSADAIARLFARTNKRIGLCLDTAWALDSREDPIAMVEQFADRLYSVHIKDFIFDRAAKPQDVVVGTGNLDLPRFMQTLDQVRFTGAAILEYEGDIDDPVPALAKCVEALHTALA